MEHFNLRHLSLFIEEEVYLIPGDEISRKFHQNNTHEILPKNEALDLELEDIKQSSPAHQKISFKGNFEKGVLVIVEDGELNSETQELLFKILGAVGCGLKDIALVLSNQLEETSMDTIHDLNPSKIIVFGKLAHDLMHFREDLYKIHVEDSIEFLFADELSSIMTNVSMKKSLWNQLQVLFGIKK